MILTAKNETWEIFVNQHVEKSRSLGEEIQKQQKCSHWGRMRKFYLFLSESTQNFNRMKLREF